MSRISSCNERDQNAKGCKAVDETPLEVDLVTQLDPARDLQRLHSLIIGMIRNIANFERVLMLSVLKLQQI